MGFALGCWPRGNTEAKDKRKALAMIYVLTETKRGNVCVFVCVKGEYMKKKISWLI